MNIIWSPTARKRFFSILNYLEQNWSKNEVLSFIDKVNNILGLIKENPKMFEESSTVKNIRKGTITPQNKLIYRIKPRKKEIELVTFWDNRMDDKKLKY